MRGWHSVGVLAAPPQTFWEPAALGTRVKEELAKGVTKKESMAEVMSAGRS
jgi:hypothetical protein